MAYDASTKSRKYPMSGGNTGKSYGGGGKKPAMHNVFGVVTGSSGHANTSTPSGEKSSGKGGRNANYGSVNGYD